MQPVLTAGVRKLSSLLLAWHASNSGTDTQCDIYSDRCGLNHVCIRFIRSNIRIQKILYAVLANPTFTLPVSSLASCTADLCAKVIINLLAYNRC